MEDSERGRAFVKNDDTGKWFIRLPDFIEESSRPVMGTNPLIIRNPSFHYLVFPTYNKEIDYSQLPKISRMDELVSEEKSDLEEYDEIEI